MEKYTGTPRLYTLYPTHCVVKKKKKKTPQVVANKRWGLSLGLQMLGVHLLYEPSAIKKGKSAAESNGK